MDWKQYFSENSGVICENPSEELELLTAVLDQGMPIDFDKMAKKLCRRSCQWSTSTGRAFLSCHIRDCVRKDCYTHYRRGLHPLQRRSRGRSP